MNKIFGIIKDGIVENAIVVDSYAVAQSLLPGAVLIESTELTGPCYVGGSFFEGVFFPEQPFDSWVRDVEKKSWKAPIDPPEMPVGFYPVWDEETVKWVEKEIPGFEFEDK